MIKKRKGDPAAVPVPVFTHDLVLLASDGQMKQLICALLDHRTPAIHCRPVNYQAITHPELDPGCVNRPDGLLASYRNTHRHALVVFDREGCGQESKTREELEAQVELLLSRTGWGDRARVVVMNPELENWIWSRSVHVANALGWADKNQGMYEWLLENEFVRDTNQVKPTRPKEAAEAVLRHARKPRSGAIYAAIAERASVAACEDPAFHKFRDTLREWFPLPTRG